MALTAPFLKSIAIDPSRRDAEHFPFKSIGFLDDHFQINFTDRITFFVGENGSGKSTVLEAIGEICGFHKGGGSHMHQLHGTDDGVQSALGQSLKASWLPKVREGFFFRSEAFFDVASYVDKVIREDRKGTWDAYGGTPLHSQSHGESFLAVFQHAFRTNRKQMFLLDEPETALSPSRQLSFLSLLHDWYLSGNAQLIIATHSPIILAYPNARIIEFTPEGLRDVAYEDTEHYQITKSFLSNPQRFLKELME